MVDIVTFPCKYLFFSTGYENRLKDEELIGPLNDFCVDKGIVPIAVINSIYVANPVNIHVFHVVDGRIEVGGNATLEENTIAVDLSTLVLRNNLGTRGGIIFSVGNFGKATEVFSNMDSIEYCAMYNIILIKFLKNEHGDIDMAYVSYEAESG